MLQKRPLPDSQPSPPNQLAKQWSLVPPVVTDTAGWGARGRVQGTVPGGREGLDSPRTAGVPGPGGMVLAARCAARARQAAAPPCPRFPSTWSRWGKPCRRRDAPWHPTPPAGVPYGTAVEDVEEGAEFVPGDAVRVVFQSACPRNSLGRPTFLTVERQDPSTGAWAVIATDDEWETRFEWGRCVRGCGCVGVGREGLGGKG